MMNPVALITGASRGIGRGIAQTLATLGYDLLINYAGNELAAQECVRTCEQTARQHGLTIRAHPCQADVGNARDRARLLDETRARFGRLDLLVNNAGITSIGRADLLEATEENFDRLIAVNLKGPFFLAQHAARWMIEQLGPRPDSKPKIIFISSVSAYAVSTNRGDYCVAKAALGMVTQLFAARLAAHDIQVFEIRPGIVATDMTGPVREKYDHLISQGLTPIPRWGQPEDVGRAVSALAQNLFPFSTGEVINVDGGFHIRQL